MYALGLAARWAHLTGAIVLVGAAVTILLSGRSDRPSALRWESRVLALARGLAVLTLVAGLALLAAQTALLEGHAAAALEPAAVVRVLLETQSGRLWLVRQGLLLLLAVCLAVRWNVQRGLDWRAARGETVLLGAAALVLIGAAGHAAAVEPGTTRALVIDGVHLLAAGIWAGGLLPLLLLCRAASREDGADARPYAVIAVQRFSRRASCAMSVLVVSGVLMAVTQLATVAALVGTPYGRLLLLKLALLVPILALARMNRRHHLPQLAGDAEAVGRPAMRRLATFLGWEAALAVALLAVVAVMSSTPPGRHGAPVWPFPFRLSTAALEDAPGMRAQALLGSQVAVLGLVGLLAAARLRAGRLALAAGSVLGLVAGALLALPALAIDAYPTTYVRPPVPYQAASLATGAALYQEHCATCHGSTGAGDGRAGRRLPRPPADLRAPHTNQHTAGDLFWWITNGILRGQMPAFGARLSVDERWDLVNFLRALSAGYAARRLGPVIEPDRPWLVAPDFAFAVGPTPPQALKDHRGRRIVLLVLYGLPGSRPRIEQLARSHDVLTTLGVEVIAVPVDGAPDALKRLGATPRVVFPVATDGASDIVAAYGLFATAPHAELLIDRQGYIRAIVRTRGEAGEINALLAEIQQLNEEKTPAPPPDEHVH